MRLLTQVGHALMILGGLAMALGLLSAILQFGARDSHPVLVIFFGLALALLGGMICTLGEVLGRLGDRERQGGERHST